jgi:hypothetical protein
MGGEPPNRVPHPFRQHYRRIGWGIVCGSKRPLSSTHPNPWVPHPEPPDRAMVGEPIQSPHPCIALALQLPVLPITKANTFRPEAQGVSPANKRHAEGATALPEAGVKSEGRNDLIYRFCSCRYFRLCLCPNPPPPNYFSRFYSAKSHVKPPNPLKSL